MMCRSYLRILVLLALFLHSSVDACTIFTLVRDGRVFMGNNEDYVRPGIVWFVPGDDGRYGRINFGFNDDFAQGSMNEKGLSFDGAALQEVPWSEDPAKATPDNLIEKIMNECATVAEALEYFELYNCRYMANSQLMFADATGDAAVVAWLPDTGLSVTRISGDHLGVTNTRLEASGYRCPRFVRVDQVLAEREGASVETMAAVLDAVHQEGPDGFTTYSTVYDLKSRVVYVYNLADFRNTIRFDLAEELTKGRKKYALASLAKHFSQATTLQDIRSREQRVDFGTRVRLDATTLDRFVGAYAPAGVPGSEFRVERDGEKLRVVVPNQPDALLFPESPTLFRIEPDRGQVSFHVDEEGRVTGLTLHSQRDLVATRVQR